MVDMGLDPTEMQVAELLATQRAAVNAANGVVDRRQSGPTGYSIEIGGYGAEIALCKYLNVAPDLSSTLKKGAGDMIFRGWKIDSKWTANPEGTMNVVTWKKKNPCDIYFMVTGMYPDYRIIGWAWGTEVFQDKYLHTFKGTYYRVPPGHLHPVEAIWEIGAR